MLAMLRQAHTLHYGLKIIIGGNPSYSTYSIISLRGSPNKTDYFKVAGGIFMTC